MTLDEAMRASTRCCRTCGWSAAFLKHSPEAEEDEELCEVHRTLYDYMLALGGPWKEQNAAEYLKLARKKYSKLRQAAADFSAMQAEISTHTNFEMAAQSLMAAVKEVGDVLEQIQQGWLLG